MDAVKFSIIILNYRSERLTNMCLKAITTHIGDLYDGEVIVVDNASGTEEWPVLREKWEKVGIQFIESESNVGYGKGNQLGIAKAQGEYLILMNPDVEVKEGAIETMIDHLDQHPDVGIVGPQLVYPDGTIQDSYRVFPTPLDLLARRSTLLRQHKIFSPRLREYLMLDKDPHQTDEVDWLVGACLVIRRKALDQVGGFDPRFFLFFEDTDLCRRMWESNWRVIYLPDAKAIHHKEERLSGNDLLLSIGKKTFWIHVHSGIRYFWKWR